jgi:hypothetical protein
MQIIRYILSKLNLDYTSILESYIISRNPSSVAEIEFLTREFERRHLSSWNY